MSNNIKTAGTGSIIELQLSVLVFQEGDYYVAFCPTLHLSSYGDSIEDAKAGFDDAMKTYLEYCKENGTLHEDLIKNGWNFNIENHEKVEPPSMVELNIPAGSLRTQYNENWTISFNEQWV